jgi:hypothetical protein
VWKEKKQRKNDHHPGTTIILGLMSASNTSTPDNAYEYRDDRQDKENVNHSACGVSQETNEPCYYQHDSYDIQDATHNYKLFSFVGS